MKIVHSAFMYTGEKCIRVNMKDNFMISIYWRDFSSLKQ